MSWFKTILLLGVLGMTWVECDRRPVAQSHAWPEAAYESAATNAAVTRPVPDAVSVVPGATSHGAVRARMVAAESGFRWP